MGLLALQGWKRACPAPSRVRACPRPRAQPPRPGRGSRRRCRRSSRPSWRQCCPPTAGPAARRAWPSARSTAGRCCSPTSSAGWRPAAAAGNRRGSGLGSCLPPCRASLRRPPHPGLQPPPPAPQAASLLWVALAHPLPRRGARHPPCSALQVRTGLGPHTLPRVKAGPPLLPLSPNRGSGPRVGSPGPQLCLRESDPTLQPLQEVGRQCLPPVSSEQTGAQSTGVALSPPPPRHCLYLAVRGHQGRPQEPGAAQMLQRGPHLLQV